MFALARFFVVLVVAFWVGGALGQVGAGVVVSVGRLVVMEGEMGTYTVRLRAAPGEGARVAVRAIPVSQGAISVSVSTNPNPTNPDTTTDTLVFTTANWNTAQTVTVTARQDADSNDANGYVIHSVIGYDRFAGSAPSVLVRVIDDDNTSPSFGAAQIQAQTYITGFPIALTLPQADGGDGALTYSVTPETALPGGLSFNAVTRVLAGTPNAAADATLNYIATDADTHTTAADRAALVFRVTVLTDIAPSFGAARIAPQVVVPDSAVAVTLPAASGGNFGVTYALTPPDALPDGLTFNPATRAIEGTPPAPAPTPPNTPTPAPATLTYTATDTDINTAAADRAALVFTVAVQANTAPSFGDARIESLNYSNGDPLTLTLPQADGGNGALRYTLTPASALPDGLRFIPATRTLSGAPAPTDGTLTLTYTAHDSDNFATAADQAALTFTLFVQPFAEVSFGATDNVARTFVSGTPATIALPSFSGGFGTIAPLVNPPLPGGLTIRRAGTRLMLSGTAVSGELSVTNHRLEVVDGFGSRDILNFSVHVHPTSVCFRTPAVRDALVAAIPGNATCAQVTAGQLGAVTTLNLNSQPITELSAGVFEGLSSLKTLFMHSNGLTEIHADAFAGLGALTQLELFNSRGLTALPVDLFDGLSALENVRLGNNGFTTIPAGIFDGLSTLTEVQLLSARLTALPDGVFDGLSALRILVLTGNDLTTLPAGIFDGLEALNILSLHGNKLTSLSATLFSDNRRLTSLSLSGNRLTALPEGLFDGVESLTALQLHGNPTNPFVFNLELLQGSSLQRVRLREAAPLAVAFDWRLAAGNSRTVTLPAGRRLSERIGFIGQQEPSVTISNARIAGNTENTADTTGQLTGFRLATPPPAPEVVISTTTVSVEENDINWFYAVVLNTRPSGAVTVTPALNPSDADLALNPSALTFATGNWFRPQVFTLSVVADADNLDETSTISHAVSGYGGITTGGDIIVSIDELDKPLSFSRVFSHQFYAVNTPIAAVTLPDASGDFPFTYALSPIPAGLTYDPATRTLSGTPTAAAAVTTTTHTVTDRDGDTATQDVSITVYPSSACVDRSPAVVTAILSAVTRTNDCNLITQADLDGITVLNVVASPNSTPQSGDFRDLPGLTTLAMRDAQYAPLPAGIFAGLDNLSVLGLGNNGLTSLPDGVFDGLSRLSRLSLRNNQLTTLPAGAFDDLSELTVVVMDGNLLETLPDGLFAGRDKLTLLMLERNRLTTLPAGVFRGVSALTSLRLLDNEIATLPAGAFDGLSALTTLNLQNNNLTTLPVGAFDGLGSLTDLILQENELTTLPAGTFRGLVALEELYLSNNQIAALPAGIFAGLNAMDTMTANDNPITSAPAGLFAGLAAVNVISLDFTRLTALPDGFFDGMRMPDRLTLARVINGADFNRLDMPVTVEQVGNGQVRAYIRTATPRPVRVDWAIAGGASGAADIAVGSRYSAPFGAAGATPATVRLSNARFIDPPRLPLPGSEPRSYQGFELRAVSAAVPAVVFSVTNLELGEGDIATYTVTLNTAPTGTVTVTPSLPSHETSVTLTPATGSALTFTAANWHRAHTVTVTAAEDADSLDGLATINHALAGYDTVSAARSLVVTVTDDDKPRFGVAPIAPQIYLVGAAITPLTLPAVTGGSGALAYALIPPVPGLTLDSTTRVLSGTPTTPAPARNHIVRVTDADGNTDTRIVPIDIYPTDVCFRTPVVRDWLVAYLSEANNCTEVTPAGLRRITRMSLADRGIETLRRGDFAGLTSLRFLSLKGNRLSALPDGLFAGLDALTELNLEANSIAALNGEMFKGLSAVTILNLGANSFTDFPAGVFTPLTSLVELYLLNSRLTTLPVGAFRGSPVRFLTLRFSPLTSLPAGAFDGMRSLDELNMADTQLTTLPAGLFDETTFLREVNSARGQISSLPAGLFDGLEQLRVVVLSGNALTDLPDGFFDGISPRLNELSVAPSRNVLLPLNVDLMQYGNGQVRARIRQAAPLPVEVTWRNGEGEAMTANIPAGSRFSAPLGEPGIAAPQQALVSARFAVPLREPGKRFAGFELATATQAQAAALITPDALTLNAGEAATYTVVLNTAPGGTVTVSPPTITPPDHDLTASGGGLTFTTANWHLAQTLTVSAATDIDPDDDTAFISHALSGYAGVESADLVVTVIDAGDFAPSFGDATVGDSTYYVSVAIAPLALPDASGGNGILRYALEPRATIPRGLTFNAATRRLEGTPRAVTAEQGVTLTYTASDADANRGGDDRASLTFTVTVRPTVCTRSPVVRAALVAAAGVTQCGEVTPAHLRAITALNLSGRAIGGGLLEDDFGGLSALRTLNLRGGGITALPASVFVGLDALVDLDLSGNQLTALPDGVFDGLNALSGLNLSDNRLSALPSGVFDDLGQLTTLNLSDNQLAALAAATSDDPTAGVFDGLSELVTLNLSDNRLTALPSGVFDDLSALATLSLNDNRIAAFNAGVFTNLRALTLLALDDNPFATLPAALFNGLSRLNILTLGGAQLTALPAGLFDELSALTYLSIHDSPLLTALPGGLFGAAGEGVTGLGRLRLLTLRNNGLTTLPIGAFARLSALTTLFLNNNRLATLPDGAFTGLRALTVLDLRANRLTTLAAALFTPLDALTTLRLSRNRLATLPAMPFATVTTLNTLWLDDNQLAALPAGMFAGLGALRQLRLHGNTGAPFTLTISPAHADDGELRARIASGAPLALSVDWRLRGGGGGGTGVANIAAGGDSSGAAIAGATSARHSVVFSNARFTGLPAGEDTADTRGAYSGFQLGTRSSPYVTILPLALSVLEGDSVTYTVALSAEPAADVTLTAGGGDDSVASVSPAVLTFTATDWNQAQTVSVTGVADLDALADAPVTVSHAVTSADADYHDINLSEVDVTVTVREDDRPVVTVSPRALTVGEGGGGGYGVVLKTQPGGEVTVTPSVGGGGGDVAITTAALTFTAADWNVAQSVSVTAAEDFDGGDDTATISHAVGGADYAGVAAADVTVTVDDNDTDGVIISRTALSLIEGGENSGTYTVRLATLPGGGVSAGVTVTIAPSVSPPDHDLTLSRNGIVLSALTFASGEWNIAQNVTVAAADDLDFTADTATIAFAVSGYGAVTDAARITVTVADAGDFTPAFADDARIESQEYAVGVAITPLTLPRAAGGNGALNYALAQSVAGGADIALASALPGLTFDSATRVLSGTPTRATPAPTTTAITLTYTASDADANTAATDTDTLSVAVIVRAAPSFGGVTVDDMTYIATRAIAQLRLPLASGGDGALTYTLSPDLPAGLTLFATSGTRVIHGAPLPVASAETVTLTYTVTDSDADTSAADGDALTFTLTVRPVPVRVAPTSLTVDEGERATFTMALTARPSGALAVGAVFVGDDSGVSVLPDAGLRFTSGNWNVAQTVTVVANEDFNADDETVTLAVSAPVASQSDPDYIGVTLPTVTVAVNDNDLDGVAVTPFRSDLDLVALTVDEGASVIYEVELRAQPDGDVSVLPSIVGAPHDLSLSTDGDALTFGVDNWSHVQRVTLAAAEDDDAIADATATLRHAVSGADYAGVVVADVPVTVIEDDDVGVDVSPIDLTVTEGGVSGYSVVLDTLPSGDVTITPTSDAPATATASPAAVTFTVADWNVAQSVFVTAAEDEDGNDDTATISHAVGGADYDGIDLSAFDVAVTVDDNDIKGVDLSVSALTVGEGGAGGAYTVRLATEPSGEVTVTASIALSDHDLTLTPGVDEALTFTVGNWNDAQTIVVAGGEDDDAGDDTVAITHTAGGADYDAAVAAGVTVTISDNDRVGVTVSRTALTVREGEFGGYIVALTSAPSVGEVTVTPSSGDGDVVTVTTAALVFDTNNWNMPQTVSVQGVADDDAVADSPVVITNAVTVSDASSDYNGATAAGVTVTVNETGTAAVTISTPDLTVDEDGDNTYTIVLTSAPSGGGDATVTPTSADNTIATVSSALTFTADNWNDEQTVTVTGVEDGDAGDEMVSITHAVVGYDNIATAATVTVTVTDPDIPAVRFSRNAVTLAENANATYTVRLDTQPSGNVTITPDSDDDDVATVSGALVFTDSNWDTAQTVTVTGADDDNSETDTTTITHTVVGYGGVTAGDVAVTVTDTDTPGVTISKATLNIGEGSSGGTGNTYTVVLNTQPSGDVTVALSSDNSDVTAGVNTLNFTTGNWNTPQSVVVSAAEDDDGNDDTANITHTVSGANYGGVAISNNPVVVTVTDNDTDGITLSATALTVAENATENYTVRLATQPDGEVTIMPLSGDTAIATVSGVLVFTTANWNAAQQVTVTGIKDADAVADVAVSISHTVSGSAYYAGVSVGSVMVTVTVTETDMRGVTISETSVDVTEGGSGIYTVVLTSAPSGGDVTVMLGGVAGSDLTLSRDGVALGSSGGLVFGSNNWSTAQTITLTAAEDDDAVTDATVTITHAVAGADYTGETATDVTVTITENDSVGITVTETTLTVDEGEFGSYTVRLTSAPSVGEVTVTPSSGDVSVVTVTATALVFDTNNWNIQQTISVQGVADDDAVADAPVVITNAVTVSDGSSDYNSATAAGVTVTVTETGTAAVTITQPP